MDDQDTYPFIVVCQKNCSGHGHCDMKTKRCICEAFWTSNLCSCTGSTGRLTVVGLLTSPFTLRCN
ncbi:hypothetical protein DPMN_102588 [Dreissena polymorpha]|uniref:Epidermal growth factor-like domain-containing protein n=1 Tax=Dreissena polymorpha TaxID=45954 RepID=A0A9D4LKM4_DREPO|nr:hypothetical protein DPMN_102588 [Dreissena polymorpha]